MGRASAWGRGGAAFVLSWVGLVAACWNGGRLLTGSTDVILPSPLAFALLFGWLPALAIGGATVVVTRTWPRAAGPFLGALLLAIAATTAVLHFGLRIGDTPESVRDRVAGEASALRPGRVADHLKRPRATALERDAALAVLADRAVWRRIETPDGLLPADADAIEAAVLARLEAAPTEGTAHVLLVALATDRLRRASLADTLARWPAHAHDVFSAAAQQPELVLRAAGGCLDPADRSASRAVATRSLAASPADARRWLRWLAWSELRCLEPGRLAAMLEACAAAPRDADRGWCVGMVLRELPPPRDRPVALDDADLTAVAAALDAAVAAGRIRPREAERLRLWLASRRAGERAASDASAAVR